MKIEDGDWDKLTTSLSGNTDRANVNLYVSSGDVPDQVAEARSLGKRYGVPTSFVQADLQTYKERARAEDRRQHMEGAPGLNRFIADDVTNAALVDDVSMGQMGFFERKWRSLASDGLGQFPQAISGTGEFLNAMQRRVIEGIANVVLPKPMAGGKIDPSSLTGPMIGEGWIDAAKPAKEYWKAAGVPSDQRDFADDVVGGLGQFAGQAAAIAANPLLGGAMLVGQGADQMAEKTAGDTSSQANKDWALMGGGAVIGATEFLSNKFITGMEKFAPGLKTLDFKSPLAGRAARVGMAGLSEATQESSENILMDVLRQQLTNPDAKIDFGDAAYAGGVGGTVGAIARGMIESAMHIRSRGNRAAFDALHEVSSGNKLKENAPDAYRSFIEKATEDGPVNNVFIPAERFATYFQGAGIEPRVAAENVGATNFAEAMATGSDIVIPIADFATRLAGTDHFAGLVDDLRLHQGDMTARELAEWQADAEQRNADIEQRIRQVVDEGRRSAGINAAIDRIVSDVEGQLIASGMDRSTASYNANAMRGIAVAAQRAFPDQNIEDVVKQLWQNYGLKIKRDLPAVLTQLKDADIGLDPLLDMLRGTGGPTDRQTFGESLTEFLRASGGIRDDGGELSGRDADAERRPFQRKLSQPDGMSYDAARELAAERGYPVGETEADFLDALDADIGGTPVYSALQTNDDKAALQQHLATLDRALRDAGIDLNAVDNQTARKLLEKHGEVAEGAFSQSQSYTADTIEIDGVTRPTTNSNGKPIAQTEEGLRNFWRWFGSSRVVDADGRPLVVYHGTTADIEAFDLKRSGEVGYKFADAAFFTSSQTIASGYAQRLSNDEEHSSLAGAEDALRSKYGKAVLEQFQATGKTAGEISDPIKAEYDAAVEARRARRAAVFNNEVAIYGANIVPVYLRIDQPVEIDADGGFYFNTHQQAFDEAVASGADGVIVRNVIDRANEVQGGASNIFAVFSPTQIKSATGNRGTFDPADANILHQQNVNDFLDLFDAADTIELTDATMSEEQIDEAERQFLSAFPEGTRYGRDTRLLKRVRRESDAALESLRGNPEVSREVASRLGPFSSYQSVAEILPPDSFNPNGSLRIAIFGKEQTDAGLVDEPALTITVTADGELTINGPEPGTDTFAEFKARGWADHAKGANGEVQQGWTALTNPENPGQPLPIKQLLPLLADTHARVREWRGDEYVGLHWTRATGALGGLFSQDESAVFFQSKDQPRDLVITHNLTAENLLHAVKMGGIPVPSLAVTKKDLPLTGFGEITLIGSKEMADPKGYAGTKVFGADIYSPRYPSITYKLDAKAQKKLSGILDKYSDATGVNYFDLDTIEREGARGLERDERVMAAFLDSNGIKFETARHAQPELPDALKPFAEDARFSHDLVADPAFIEAAWQEHTDELAQAYDGDRAAAEGEVAQERARAEQSGVSYLVRGKYRKIESYRRDLRDAGKVDRNSTRINMNNLIEKNDLGREFEAFAKDMLSSLEPDEKIFQGFTNSGNRRYIDHTLENVVKILKKELRGGEGFGYGLGNVRAHYTPQFKSVEQIRKSKDRLIGKAEFEAVKDELDAAFDSLADSLSPYHPISGEFRFGDTMTYMLSDVGKMGVDRALKENGFKDVPEEIRKEVAEFVGKLRNLPTEYFEAKILRDVDLTEFSGAVVPEGVDQKVIDALHARGVKDVRTYKNGDEADRAAKIGEFEHLFFQNKDANRGSIQFGENVTITLTQNADLSTFLHETGHFYLEMMGDLSEMEGASDAVKADYKTLLDWMGVSSRAEIQREHHEMFARANEAYLMEGKSPSPELRSVFQRFSAWLLSIYKNVTSLNVQLSDEVRGVFDRLYATDEEIDAASREVNIDPMPAEAMRARMTAEEFAIYQNSVAQVAQDGKDELRVKLMREFQRGKKQWWRDEEARVRAEVTEEVDSQPVYAAFNGLQAEKLSQADLEYRYGADFIKTLPRGFGRIYGRNGTLFADQAAEKFGFASADEMMQALASMRQRRELIEAETAVRMRELHGDMLTDGSAYDAAQSALHNDRRAEVLAIELRAMGGKVASAQLKRAAESAIGRTRHSELRPYAYLLAGNRAAREAFKAAMAGDFDAARDAKQRELLNHHMYRAAHDAKTEADGIANHMRKLQTDSKLRAKIGKTGQEWLGQIDDILVRFSFSPLARTQKFRSLAEWAMAEEEQTGEVIAISPLVMDEAFKTNWREMTIDELRAIDDTLKSIEHVSKKLQEVLLNGRRYEMEQIVAKLMATIEASKLKHRDPKRPGEDLSLKDKFLAVDGTLWRPEKIMEMLDNGTTGIFHDLLWDRATKAQTIAKDLKKQVLLPLESLITGMNKADSARMEEVVYIGSLGAGIRRFELIGMALNMGNASNLSKLQRGGIVLPGNKNPTPLGHQTINEVKAALSESDWNMVQTMWRTIEQLYPHLNDLNQRAVGLPLKKVDPITVETPFGDIRGGYWPAVGNPLYSNVGEVQENSNSVSAADFFPQPFAKAATKHSFREARTEAAYPLQFDWRQVLSRHVAQATTDIAYHEFVKEVSRILRNQDVKLALIGKLGQEKYQGLNDWLSFQVNASMGGMASARPVHVAMQGIVANTAVAALGYKVMTAIGNVIVAPVQASHQIKGRYIAAGYAEFMANPKAAMAKVRELSGEMRHRHDHLDATFNQVLDSLSGKATLRKAIAKNAMEIHSIADVLATTGLWLGKYRQSLAEGMEPKQAIKAADKTIRTSQTAGAPKDLSAFERDPSFAWAKLFLGPMIIMQNEARGSFLLKRRRLQTLMAVWLLPAIVFEMAVGRGPDDDEEPEEWALRKILTYPMQTVPLLRDAAPLVEAAITGKQPMMRMNPVAEVAGSIINTGRKLLSDTADDGDKAQAIIQTGGLLTGLPGAAVGQLSNYAIDLATGETSMEGPGDIRFFFMRRKDDRLD